MQSQCRAYLIILVDILCLEPMSQLFVVLSAQALRRYMLLGQGDFIRHLMDLLE